LITSYQYVLVTAAYNEGRFIANTIDSIISQEIRPVKWIIVSDGSTDETDAIISKYSNENDFIQFYRITEDHSRNFKAQVHAINAGISCLRDEKYAYFGNLDADITLDPSYFKLLLEKFHQNPRLGLAGGTIYDKCRNEDFKYRPTNRVYSVAHAVQLFRRECFEMIGGDYRQLPYGGPDTYAEIEARRQGWQVASFPELKVLHNRPTGSAGGALRGCFRQGRMDYTLGVSPFFQIIKMLLRIGNRPYIFGSIARMAGLAYSYCSKEKRAVPPEFIRYLREEEMRRLKGIFGTM